MNATSISPGLELFRGFARGERQQFADLPLHPSTLDQFQRQRARPATLRPGLRERRSVALAVLVVGAAFRPRRHHDPVRRLRMQP